MTRDLGVAEETASTAVRAGIFRRPVAVSDPLIEGGYRQTPVSETQQPTIAVEPETALSAHGLGPTEITFVLENLLPIQYVARVTSANRLLEHAAGYVQLTAVDRLYDMRTNLLLVKPCFSDPSISGQYSDALNSAAGTVTAHEQLRRALLEAATRDFLKLGPAIGGLGKSQESVASSALVSLGNLNRLADRLANEDRVQREEAHDTAPRPRQLAIEAAALSLLGDLDNHALDADRTVRRASLPVSEAKAQQLVLMAAQYGAHAIAGAPGRSLSLPIEIDSPPPPGSRHPEEFPLLRHTMLPVLRMLWPQMFDAIRSEDELNGPGREAQLGALADIALGRDDLSLYRRGGVLGIFAAVAAGPLTALRGGPRHVD